MPDGERKVFVTFEPHPVPASPDVSPGWRSGSRTAPRTRGTPPLPETLECPGPQRSVPSRIPIPQQPITCPPGQSAQSVASPADAAAPNVQSGQHLGRYRVEQILGQGGFGQVFLAWDEDLHRRVAIKVASRVATDASAEVYLAEARIVARLDHPHIVPVYDVGRTEQGQLFAVSKLIDGRDLAACLEARRLPLEQSARLVSTIAEALHYAHERGLVHRDIKPQNILLDEAGRPFVCDFGLALRDEDYGMGPELAGTPAYMSPEQARW